MQIIPTILEKDFYQARVKLDLIKDLTKWVQIDVIDGVFTQGKTFELELLTKTEINIDNFLFDIHLMVKEPIKWIEKCMFVSANRVIGQVEMMSDREEFVAKVIETGMEVGLAFNIDTKISEIPIETDVVLLMGRRAGFENHEFDKKIFEKIDELQKLKKEKELKFEIGVDGGINLENIKLLQEKNIDIAYCGAVVFNGNVNNNFIKLLNFQFPKKTK